MSSEAGHSPLGNKDSGCNARTDNNSLREIKPSVLLKLRISNRHYSMGTQTKMIT